MRGEITRCLNAQIVLELKNCRMIMQTQSKLAQRRADQRVRPGVVNTLGASRKTDSLRFALFLFCDCDGDLARRTRFARIVYRWRAAGRVFRLT